MADYGPLNAPSLLRTFFTAGAHCATAPKLANVKVMPLDYGVQGHQISRANAQAIVYFALVLVDDGIEPPDGSCQGIIILVGCILSGGRGCGGRCRRRGRRSRGGTYRIYGCGNRVSLGLIGGYFSGGGGVRGRRSSVRFLPVSRNQHGGG